MRIIPASQVVPVRVSGATTERVSEPPTSIWSPGALLRADINGIRYYGSVCYIDDHVDYMTVRSSQLIGGLLTEVEWSGTKERFESTWSFARYTGVG